MADGSFQRFLGGSVGSVVAKLIFLSILVGAFMAFLGMTPFALVDGLVEAVRRFADNGFRALREVGLWFVYGAVIVIPIFLMVRLIGAGRR